MQLSPLAPMKVQEGNWAFRPLALGLQHKKLQLCACQSYETRIFSPS